MMNTNSLIGIVSMVALGALAGCSDGDDGPTPIPGGTDGGGGDTTGGTGGTDGPAAEPSQVFGGSGTWIDMSENTVGIQGAFFVLEDSMADGTAVDDGLTHTDLEPDEFDEDTEKPCVNGTVAQVTDASGEECDPAGTDCEWSAIWGGGLGLNLNETGGDMSEKSTFDAAANGVSGFGFTLSGDTGGAIVRFKAKMEGSDSDFCSQVKVGEAVTVDLADLEHNCYPGGEQTETLDTSKLVQLEWQIVPTAEESYTVTDFCVEEVGYY